MLAAGSNSPGRRIKLSTQLRTSATPAPRSIPTPTATALSHHEQWGSAYSPVSSSVERSPSAADVSPVAGSMRWGQQAPQVNPPIPEPERHLHQVDPNIQQPMGYSYVVDSTGRPVQPVQPVTYQSEAQMMPSYSQTSPHSSVNDYHNRHSGLPLSTVHTPTYQYPPSQGFHSPHEADPHMQQMLHRQSMDSQQQLLYNMPQDMKAEH